jgi:two-component system response regulator RegA
MHRLTVDFSSHKGRPLPVTIALDEDLAQTDDSANPLVAGKPVVLCLEDDANMRAMLAEIFRHHGYRVVTTHTVAGAMRLFSEQKINALILDVNLAGENGLDLVPYLAANYPETALTVYSGVDVDTQRLETARAWKTFRLIKKSQPISELINAVRDSLKSAALPASD